MLKEHFTKASKHHQKMSSVHEDVALAHHKLAAQHTSGGKDEIAQHHRDLRAAHQRFAKLHAAHGEHLSAMADACDGDAATKGALSDEDRRFRRRLVG